MIRKIKKRDGKIVDFNPVKITEAIWKAAQAVGGKDYKRAAELTDNVITLLEKELKRGEIPTVEQVQDIVEKVLIEDGHAKTAKAYILYRKQHQDMREIGGLLKDIDVVDGYLSMMDWKVNENSNMAYSLQGLNVYATESIISHYWLNKIYPPEIGDAHTKGDYHIHDLGTLGAYTYFGKETIVAKYHEKILLTSFQDLYETLEADEKHLSKKDGAWAKYPKSMQVLDVNGWTNVQRIVKKTKQKQMRFLKNEGGRSVIVTEDHPMIMGDEIFKEAKNVKEEDDKLLTVDVKELLKNDELFYKNHIVLAQELYEKGMTEFFIEGMPFEEYLTYSHDLMIDGIISTSNNADSLPNRIELTENLGYFVGFYIAEGWMEPHRIGFTQKNTPDAQHKLKKIHTAAYSLGCRIYTNETDGMFCLRITNTTLVEYLFKKIFNLEGLSKEKRLPAEILTYNQDFVRGVIAGILDGDGSINTSQTSVIIRTASRTMLEQVATLLNILGFTARDRNLEGVGSTRIYNEREIIQHYPLFGISFRTRETSLPSQVYLTAQLSTSAWRAEGSGWHKVLNNEPTEILDDYIYDITTESNTLIVNGMWNHNCVGWDLKDLLLLGFKGVAGKIESKPAKHFSTALMQIVNYLYTLQGEAAGAQALSNFDSLLAPFVAHDHLNYDQIKQEMQKFLFNMNVPTRVGFQSPFSNCTIDLTIPGYLTEEPAIIGGELTDNNYSEYTEEMEMINRAFAENMHDGDSKGRPFTFPIPTYNITKDFKWDNEGLAPLWEMTAKYGIPYFSNFINSDMKPDDARSMCPLAGDEKVLIKSSRGRGVEYASIRHIYEGNSKQGTYEIYSEGKFIKGKFNKWNDQHMLKIRLENGHEIKMSSHHLNYIINSSTEKKEEVVKARDLKPGMYLPYSLQAYEGSGGTKDLGYFVGAYAGAGSLDEDNTVVFSLENHHKKSVITKIIDIAEKYFGAHCTIAADKKTKLTTVKVHSKAAVGLCKDYVEGIKRNKKYCARVFTTGKDFRKGVIAGHYDTDGGNRNRIYTSSPQMIETLNMLAATLGTTTSIYKDERKRRLGTEPNYAVLIYQLNRMNYGDIWFKKNNKLWVKIKEITPITNSAAYCFEVNNGTPVFTIGTTGILTHNCRLRLDNRELRKRGGGLFGANPKTGSIGVVTLNMPRIGYLAKDDTDFFERLDNLMLLAKQSLEIKRELIENLTASGLHPYSRFYLSDVKKTFGEYWKNHFSTIGLIGMNDALLNFMNKSIAEPEGKAFAEKVLDHMRSRIADFQEESGNIFNLEATPGEGSLAPDEQVLVAQSDPALQAIGPLVDSYLEKNKDDIFTIGTSEMLKIPFGKMFTYGFSRRTQKIKKYPVTALVRHPGKSMYEIITFSGRSVKVTGQHSLFTLNADGIPEEVLVHDLKTGVCIAVPKQISMEPQHCEFDLFALFKNSPYRENLYGIFPADFIERLLADPLVKEWCAQHYAFAWRNVKCVWRKRHVVPLGVLYDLNIPLNQTILHSSSMFYRKSKNTVPITMVLSIDESLGFILGCLLSEGWLNERSEFTNTDKAFAEEFYRSVVRVFGPRSAFFASHVRKGGWKRRYVVTLSKSIGLFFNQIGFQGKSHEKRVPGFIFASSLACSAGLLRGFHRGDGSFYENTRKRDVSVKLQTNSQKLVEDLNILLLRFGVLTSLRTYKRSKNHPLWKDNYILSITGAENLETYFRTVMKTKMHIDSVHSGREIIPQAPRLLKKIMQRHGLKPALIGIDKDSFNKNVRQNTISIQFLRRIVQRLSERITEQDFLLDRLALLVNSDIYWDAVKEIRLLTPPQYVYDFEVDVQDDLVNNFLGGNGLVCLHNTSYRLARIDKKEYPEIRTFNQEMYTKNRGKDVEPYYTNSTQLPVGYTSDVFEALDLQDSLQTKYTGGTVLHIFLGEENPSPTACKNLIRKVAENYALPYYTITPTFSVCPDHGYISGEHRICPTCQAEKKTTECEVYSRVVGYIRPVNQWNKGKQQEFRDRRTFDLAEKVLVTA